MSDATPRTRRPFSVRMFLADGEPEGLRIVEKSHWNGVALMCSRAQYPAVRARPEFDRAGVYVLVGADESTPTGRPRVYVGEGDAVRARFDAHARGKDFWTHLVLFVSKDQALHKAHVQYLEARLVERAAEARRATVENNNAPQLPALTEADVADAESFLDDVLLILPLLGVQAFEASAGRRRKGLTLRLHGKGVSAEGADEAEGFVVFKGSQASKDAVPSLHPYLVDRRDELVRQKVLVPSDGALRFAQDFVFESPSMAAGVVLGRSSNRRVEWKAADGRTLKEIQAAAVSDEG